MTYWTPEDDPQDHPMWEVEVDLERGMMRAGADKVRDRALVAESRDQMTKTPVLRGLMTEWLPGVADAVRSWLRDVERRKGGPKPVAYDYLKDMDPYTAALIAIRALLDGVAKKRQRLVGLTLEIGRTAEHEQRVRMWEATEPDLYYAESHEMDRNKSTGVHRRRVNINRFNALLKEGTTKMHWTPWTEEVRFRVGVALLDCIIRKTGWFEVQADPEFHFRAGSVMKPQLVVTAKPGLVEWLAKAMEQAELHSPEYKPTVVPPRRWNLSDENGDWMSGGYHTPYVRTPRLVRFKASQENQRAKAADEYDALDMPGVYQAIHVLQETAWRVNKRVLDVAMKVWAGMGDASVAGLPQIDEKPLPPRTPRMVEHREATRLAREQRRPVPPLDEETDQEILAWKRKASPIHKFNAKRASRVMAASNTILIAQEYAEFEAIYFPHMLDFRGRLYPIANFLQPQGNDLSRGLLTFADGLPITEENGGAGWLAIHLAGMWGNDKVSYAERIDWVEQNEDLWRRIAADPIANMEWAVTEGPHKVGKPFQALAAIFEWVAFLDEGWGYMSSLPVMVDGTCNGIQHLSALLRDEVAGRYVNLVPSEKPQDIYKFVANQLQPTLERIARAGGPEGEKAAYWLDLCAYNIPRTLTKRQVMVLPYGGTKDSFFSYTREWLDENDPAPEPTADKEADKEAQAQRTRIVVFMANHMWNAVNSELQEEMRVMKWLQDCAKAVAVTNQPIYWEVPSGFVVRHFYGLDRSMICKIMLDGETIKVTRSEKTAKLSTKEQAQGIAPNFIHSLDASCLVECIKRCKEAGIEDFASVHDAYGTHAANLEPLSVFLREAFVELHEADLLGNFRASCERVLVDFLVSTKGLGVLDAAEEADTMLPPVLEKGRLEIRSVLESNYFFA